MEKELFFQAVRVVWQWARECFQETDSELFFFTCAICGPFGKTAAAVSE